MGQAEITSGYQTTQHSAYHAGVTFQKKQAVVFTPNFKTEQQTFKLDVEVVHTKRSTHIFLRGL